MKQQGKSEMLKNVSVKGKLRQALQVNGTVLHLEESARAALMDGLQNGDHTYAALMLDECSCTREIVKITAVDGALVVSCRGVSNTKPTAFPCGSIFDTALAATAWSEDFAKGILNANNSDKRG